MQVYSLSVWDMAVDTCGLGNVQLVSVAYGPGKRLLKQEFRCGERKIEEERTSQDD